MFFPLAVRFGHIYWQPWPNFSKLSPESWSKSQNFHLRLGKIGSILRWKHGVGVLLSGEGVMGALTSHMGFVGVAPGSSLSFLSWLSWRWDPLLSSLQKAQGVFIGSALLDPMVFTGLFAASHASEATRARTQLMILSEIPTSSRDWQVHDV